MIFEYYKITNSGKVIPVMQSELRALVHPQVLMKMRARAAQFGHCEAFGLIVKVRKENK